MIEHLKRTALRYSSAATVIGAELLADLEVLEFGILTIVGILVGRWEQANQSAKRTTEEIKAEIRKTVYTMQVRRKP